MQNCGTGSDIWRWRKRNFSSQTCAKRKILTEFIFERKSEEEKKKHNYKISFNLIAKEYVIVKWQQKMHNYLFMLENGFLS